MPSAMNTDSYKQRLKRELPSIQCLDNYAGSTSSIRHKCKVHGTEFQKAPHKLLYAAKQCTDKTLPCIHTKAKHRTHDDYVYDLKTTNPNIVPTKRFVTVNDKLEHKCLTCDTIWHATPNNILKGKGCPTCGTQRAATSLLTDAKEIEARLRKKFGNKLSVLTPYIGARKPRKYVCNVCNHTWEATVCCGCPVCSFQERNKNRFNTRPYKLGNRIVHIQGYEDKAIDWILQNTKRKPKHIQVSSDSIVPVIEYKFEGKVRKHYPDLMIEKASGGTCIVEVKSAYSFGILYASSRPKVFYKNKAKRKAAIAQGFDYRFMIMTDKGEHLKLPTNWHTMSPMRVAKELGIKYY